MSLDAHQISIIVRWMSRHMGGGCPICKGEKTLRINKSLCSMPTYDVADRTVKIDHGIPCAVITCNECGHVQLVAANVIGMVARGESGRIPQVTSGESVRAPGVSDDASTRVQKTPDGTPPRK
ncbi:MAG: hypothetical protein HUU29_02715 [Planctomycetaceae bacterium]|nr:hypothetical protein [Planctomycetaceae bacterium]